MKVSTSTITFRIDIDFPGSEVDMIFREQSINTPVPSLLTDTSKISIDESKLLKTPTSQSVDFCLNWLMGYVDRNQMVISSSKWDKDHTKMVKSKTPDGMVCSTGTVVKTELEEIGLEVDTIYDLVQGTCHLVCSCDIQSFKPELIEQAEGIVKTVFSKYVQFHEPGDEWKIA